MTLRWLSRLAGSPSSLQRPCHVVEVIAAGLYQPFPRTQRLRPSLFRCKVDVHVGLFEACSTFTGDYGLSARRVAKATRLSR
jgi:hypothetical protein